MFIAYKPHSDIENASKTQINRLLGEIGIRIQGYKPEKPVSSFGHLKFPDRLMERIRKSDFSDPTPIQGRYHFTISSDLSSSNESTLSLQ